MKVDSPSEALLIRYLLGDLPEEQQVEIEERAFTDQGYLKTMQAVETDLIDEYVRDGLPERDRIQFEARFLASEERRRKVGFAKALAIVAAEADEK
jgi:anti-sigma factor RsiW